MSEYTLQYKGKFVNRCCSPTPGLQEETTLTHTSSIKERLAPQAVLAAVLAALLAAVLVALLLAAPAHGALNVSAFSITPSTTRVGGHPDLTVSESFDPPTADIKQIVLHLPAGLTANARAAPFCRRTDLVADLCPMRTKVGDVGLVGIAFGFEAEVARNIYNLRPRGQEALRLGVPLFGSVSRGGAALVLPVTERPADHGLDVAVAGPPREISGYSVQLKEITFRLKGSVRVRIRRKLRRRAILTNPVSCGPATTTLDVVAYEGPPPAVTKVSGFTLTGC